MKWRPLWALQWSCVQLSVTPWTVAYQASLFMELSRQEYWSGLPFLSPEDLPNPGIKPGSPALWAAALQLLVLILLSIYWSYSWLYLVSWRRKRQPTPVFLPGKSQVDYSLWGCRVRHDWVTNTRRVGLNLAPFFLNIIRYLGSGLLSEKLSHHGFA